MRIIAIRDIVVADPLRHRQRLYRLQPDDGERGRDRDRRRCVDGKPVVGYGFNSNGRYAQQGLLRERFIPRLHAAKPRRARRRRGLIDPAKCWAAMMANEKPGGHGERSVAVGVLDMALWDAVAKAEGVPLWKLLADRYNGGKADDDGVGLRRRRLLLSRQGPRGAAGRDEALSRPRLRA